MGELRVGGGVLGWSAFSHTDNITAQFVGLNSVYTQQMVAVGHKILRIFQKPCGDTKKQLFFPGF